MYSNTQWYKESRFVHSPAYLHPWLIHRGSLTQRLKSLSSQFSVIRLQQSHGLCLSNEYEVWSGKSRQYYPQREVLLLCDNIPLVWGYTVVVSQAVMRDWPFYQRLGTMPLGQRLFTDHSIHRGELEFSKIGDSHPYIKRLNDVLPEPIVDHPLYARRSMFYRRQGAMLVTEVFLPAINPLIAS